MASPPAKTELSDTYPNPSNAVLRGGMGKFWDYVTGLLGATGNAAEARAALGVPGINDVLGMGQTWTDVKASRTLNTNYTNSTSKPIMVSVSVASTSGVLSLLAYVDGALVGNAGAASGFNTCLSFIVPPGKIYQIQAPAGVPAIATWAELR